MMLDWIVARVARLHIGVRTLIRIMSVAVAGATFGVVIGTAWIVANDAADNSLNLAWVYPLVFALAVTLWVSAAIDPTPTKCSWAGASVAVPAAFRAVDFVVTWAEEGAQFPGSRLVAISVWTGYAFLSLGVAVLVALLADRENRRTS